MGRLQVRIVRTYVGFSFCFVCHTENIRMKKLCCWAVKLCTQPWNKKITSRTYSCTYVYVRKQQPKNWKKIRTTSTWNDVGGKLMPQGRSYQIKLRWTSFFFYSFDHQSRSMITKRTNLIGALLVVLTENTWQQQ